MQHMRNLKKGDVMIWMDEWHDKKIFESRPEDALVKLVKL